MSKIKFGFSISEFSKSNTNFDIVIQLNLSCSNLEIQWLKSNNRLYRCWKQNVLTTISRCGWQTWPLLPPTFLFILNKRLISHCCLHIFWNYAAETLFWCSLWITEKFSETNRKKIGKINICHSVPNVLCYQNIIIKTFPRNFLFILSGYIKSFPSMTDIKKRLVLTKRQNNASFAESYFSD